MQSARNRPYRINKLSPEAKRLLKEYVKKNPSNTYAQFREALGAKVKCSDAHFYSERRKAANGGSSSTGVRRYGKISSTIYKTVWSYPAEKVSPATREILKDFIEKFNMDFRANYSLIEMKEPAVVEVREAQRR